MRNLTLLAIALAACSDGTAPDTPVMTALVDGTPFASTSVRPGRYVAAFDTLHNTMMVTGVAIVRKTVSETIVLVLPRYRGAGRYPMCNSPDSAGASYWVTDVADTTLGLLYDTQSRCGLGEVDVTSYDVVHDQIDGIFHFTAPTALIANPVDSVNVTNGAFDGKISILSPPGPGPYPPLTQHN